MDKKFKKSTVTVLSLGLAFSFSFTPVFAQSASLTKSSLNNLKFKHVANEQVNVNGYTHTLDFAEPLKQMQQLMQRAQNQYNKVKQVQAKLDQLAPQISRLQTAVNKWKTVRPSFSYGAMYDLRASNQVEAAKKQNELRLLQAVQNRHEQERQKELAVLAGLLPELFDKIKSQQRILETWDSPRAILPPEQMDELDKILKQVEQLQQEQKKLTAKKRPKRELQNYDLNEGLEKQKTLRKVKEAQQQELKADLQKQETRLTDLQGLDTKIEQVQEEVKKMKGESAKTRSKRSARSAPAQTTSLVQGKYVELKTVLEKKQQAEKKEAEVKEKLDKALKEVQEQEKEVDKKLEELKKKKKEHENEELARKIVKEGYRLPEGRRITEEEWKKVIELVDSMIAEELKSSLAKK